MVFNTRTSRYYTYILWIYMTTVYNKCTRWYLTPGQANILHTYHEYTWSNKKCGMPGNCSKRSNEIFLFSTNYLGIGNLFKICWDRWSTQSKQSFLFLFYFSSFLGFLPCWAHRSLAENFGRENLQEWGL